MAHYVLRMWKISGGGWMKIKYVRKTKSDIEYWMCSASILVKSKCFTRYILDEFNRLTSDQRNSIKAELEERCNILEKILPKEEREKSTSIMLVDIHMLAYKYDVDPLTKALCEIPICRSYERIFVK